MNIEPLHPVSTVPLFEAYAPAQVAARVRDVGVAKARSPVATTLALAVLAGAFIALGALFYAVTMTGVGGELPFGPSRVLGGVAFSLGLILVVVAGAELFTSNNLMAMAWASGQLSLGEVVRNWVWVYLGNLLGALGMVVLALAADVQALGNGAVGTTFVDIARAKVMLHPVAMVGRGILCNVLVCLAVWLCLAARTVTDKILAILFPISAFVACGFEHSIANMFFLPMGLALDATHDPILSLGGALMNLLLVTLGNLFGGTVLVGLVYWFVYLRPGVTPATSSDPH